MKKEWKKPNIRRYSITILAIVSLIMSLMTVTSAWLRRVGIETRVQTAAFGIEKSGVVLPEEYTVVTKVIEMDKSRREVGKGYSNPLAPGEEIDWDDVHSVLVPGQRTIFCTTITNESTRQLVASASVLDAAYAEELRGKLIFGSIGPETQYYESTDEAFVLDTTDADFPCYRAHLLTLMTEQTIEPMGEMTVYWYITLNYDLSGGNFPILADKATGTEIKTSDGKYYFVNMVDENGEPTEAYLCNKDGVVYSTLVEYPGDYGSTTVLNRIYGNTEAMVRVPGLYVNVR